MASLAEKKLLTIDKPFWVGPRNKVEIQSMPSRTLGYTGLAAGRYTSKTGIGITTGNPPSPMILVVVLLCPNPKHASWLNGKEYLVPERQLGGISSRHLSHRVAHDLPYPFDSFHLLIPPEAFDGITTPLNQPRIEELRCTDVSGHHDEIMLGLVQAILPALAKPWEVPALFTDQVFLAILNYLALTYGGLDAKRVGLQQSRQGTLSPLQERRVTMLMLDDLAADHTIEDLAHLCGLSRGHFIRAFKQTTGLPPHRWLLAERVKRAQMLLRTTDMPISEVALACGFSDQPHLTRIFSKRLGLGPGSWRREANR